MQHNVELLMSLLRCSACGEEADEKTIKALTPEILQDIYAVTYHHGLTQLVGYYLDKSGLLGEKPSHKIFKKEVMDAVYSYEKINYEIEQITGLFEENAVPFVFLKGAVLRNLYSERFLRTSCDTDVLVHKNDLEKAGSLLEKHLGYEKTYEGTHHITYCMGDVKLELHFELIEKNQVNKAYKIARRVWDFARVKDGFKYQYELSDDFTYFYHIAHCAVHFLSGGCGIKPVLDLYVLRKHFNCESAEIEKLLRKSGLTKFHEYLNALCDVWFTGKEHSSVTRSMELFIIKGGIAGIQEQNLLLRKYRSGGSLGYIFSRLFVPFKELKSEYPILEKIPVLLPFFTVFRWFRLLIKRDKTHIFKRYRTVKNIIDEDMKAFGEMLDKTGL